MRLFFSGDRAGVLGLYSELVDAVEMFSGASRECAHWVVGSGSTVGVGGELIMYGAFAGEGVRRLHGSMGLL